MVKIELQNFKDANARKKLDLNCKFRSGPKKSSQLARAPKLVR